MRANGWAGWSQLDIWSTPRDRMLRASARALGGAGARTGPFFFGGVHQMQGALAQVLDQVAEAFRKGGGEKQAQYPPVFWDGLERFTAGWFENLLIQQWLPAMPDVEAKLRAGGLVADVGCGRGRALVKLAQSFPKSALHRL